MKVEIRDVTREILRVSETCAIVLGGVTGDGAGLLDGLAHRLGAQVRGAGGTLAFAEVDGGGNAAVPLILDRVHLTQPDGGGEPAVQARAHVALAGSTPFRLPE